MFFMRIEGSKMILTPWIASSDIFVNLHQYKLLKTTNYQKMDVLRYPRNYRWKIYCLCCYHNCAWPQIFLICVRTNINVGENREQRMIKNGFQAIENSSKRIWDFIYFWARGEIAVAIDLVFTISCFLIFATNTKSYINVEKCWSKLKRKRELFSRMCSSLINQPATSRMASQLNVLRHFF